MKQTKRKNPKDYNKACTSFGVEGAGIWTSVVTEDGWVVYAKARIGGRSLGWISSDPISIDLLDPETMKPPHESFSVDLSNFNPAGRLAIARNLLSQGYSSEQLTTVAASFRELAELLAERARKAAAR